MAYICRNIDNASQLKFWPNVMFSSALGNYIDQLADSHCIHSDAMAVVLVNCVATTMEFSHVLRANSIKNMTPINFYNIVVARSCKFELSLYIHTYIYIRNVQEMR